jgi:formate--tetrahydrofolate ligase
MQIDISENRTTFMTMNESIPHREYCPLPPLEPDIEIARRVKLREVSDIGIAAGLRVGELEFYGSSKAKVNESAFERLSGNPDGALILVTAMTATRAGEGKTVTAIGLAQALGGLGVNSVLAVREPSLGPTFGIKGGAAGGGYAQVLPMEDINMHFTGDLHAITTAHNLLAAVVDNHVYQGNELGIDPEKIIWRRAMDLCDRQLRNCDVGLGSRFDGFDHRSGFDITAASEVMAILSLASDREDLRLRLERIVVAFTADDQPVYAGQLNVVGALLVLLKDALQPNLVQTAEHTPALVHCGPFGNIAHGCNSVRATRLALKMADYVVTEAGFAADLGAEKFLNIKCRAAALTPAVAVCVVTCRALKMHGGVSYEALGAPNVEAARKGLENVRVHVENLMKFGLPVVVAVNRFTTDDPAELDAVFEYCTAKGWKAALSEVASLGGPGGRELAEAVLAIIEENRGSPSSFHCLYDADAPLKDKIETIAREIYRADGVDYDPEAETAIVKLERLGFGGLPICMAKTQLSISDDPKKLGGPTGWRLSVRDLDIRNGAGYIVVLTGKMLLMPGMPKNSAVERIGIDADGNIFGLS